MENWELKIQTLFVMLEQEQYSLAKTEVKELLPVITKRAIILKKPLERLNNQLQETPINKDEITKITIELRKKSNIEANSTLFNKIANEETYISKLNELDKSSEPSYKIIWNYWWGSNSGDFLTWTKIKKNIEEISLTQEGKYRLVARHQTLHNQIMPSFTQMAIRLWPILAIWLGSKIMNDVIGERLKEKFQNYVERFRKRNDEK